MTLREIRMERRMSLKEVAQIVGVSHTAISSYERGESMPAADVALRLATLYGVPFEEMLAMLQLERRKRDASRRQTSDAGAVGVGLTKSGDGDREVDAE